MNKKNLIIISAFVLLFASIFILSKSNPEITLNEKITQNPDLEKIDNQNPPVNKASKDNTPDNPPKEIKIPLNNPDERITKKGFGILITSQDSPVQPERFSGYHTGVDFEVFPEELNKEVPVKAVCDGEIISKQTAGGYGGLLIQSCSLENKPVTVVYGHLSIESIPKKDGDKIEKGEVVGNLGADKSIETDNERKHLHLSIHKGSEINIRGYVQNKTDLSNWIDPCLHFCQK